MLSASLLEQLVADSEERVFPELTPRNVEVPVLPGKANVVVGMRRVGETSLALDLLTQRLEQGARGELGRSEVAEQPACTLHRHQKQERDNVFLRPALCSVGVCARFLE